MPLMEINLLLVLSKIMSLMVVPCTQEYHLLTSEDINEHESTGENGAVIDESVKWRPKLYYKYAKQKLCMHTCVHTELALNMPYYESSQQVLQKF